MKNDTLCRLFEKLRNRIFTFSMNVPTPQGAHFIYLCTI